MNPRKNFISLVNKAWTIFLKFGTEKLESIWTLTGRPK